jgi:hypothetical protein
MDVLLVSPAPICGLCKVAGAVARAALCRDELTSVLSFLTLRELAAAVAVSKEWAAAVQSMRPTMLPVVISSSRLNALLASSSLRRHVGRLSQKGESGHTLSLLSRQLCAMARALPQLQSLSIRLALRPGEPQLLFPAQLQFLSVTVDQSFGRQAPTALLASIGQLHQLHTLHLRVWDEAVSLVPLQQLSLLRDLEMCLSFGHIVDQFAAELHALPWLHRLRIEGSRGTTDGQYTALFHAVLRDAPEEQLRTLQWRDFRLSGVWWSDELTPLLPRLPSLERLEGDLSCCTDFDFLAALQHLTHLDMRLVGLPVDAWTNLLGIFTSDGLARLHTLALRRGQCTSDELVTLLSHTPSLTNLVLDDQRAVSSLSFFRQLPKLAGTLHSLTLSCSSSWRLTAAGLPPLFVLQHLRELRLCNWSRSLRERLNLADRAPFEQRPCRVLPHLAMFVWTTGHER